MRDLANLLKWSGHTIGATIGATALCPAAAQMLLRNKSEWRIDSLKRELRMFRPGGNGTHLNFVNNQLTVLDI